MESAKFLTIVACGVMILCEDTNGMRRQVEGDDRPMGYASKSNQPNRGSVGSNVTSGRTSSSSSNRNNSKMIETMKRLYGEDFINQIMVIANQSSLNDTDRTSLIYTIYWLWNNSYTVNKADKQYVRSFCRELSSYIAIDHFKINLQEQKQKVAFVLLLSQLEDWNSCSHVQWRDDINRHIVMMQLTLVGI